MHDTTNAAMTASPAIDPPEHTSEELAQMHGVQPQRALTVIEGGAQARPEAENSVAAVLSTIAMLDRVDLTKMDADTVAAFREMVRDMKAEVSAQFATIAGRCDAELIARIKRDGGRAIPSFEFEKIVLEDEYSAYAYDKDKLAKAAALLPPAEAKKVLVEIPEVIVPARTVPGNTATITAMIRKYGEQSEVGKLLAGSMSRSKLGEKLVVKRAAPIAAAGAL
jgi:hypothetical protein